MRDRDIWIRDDTISAIATSTTTGGVGIVRVSGPDAQAVMQRVASGLPNDVIPNTMYFASFRDGNGNAVDKGYVVYFKAPNSYTGEDVVEFQGHGGAANLRRLLAVTISGSARSARPGEFTCRSFLNGRIDLTQAEAVMDIVSAKTNHALDVAHSHLRGGLSHSIKKIRSLMVDVLARLQAQIDFVEEDLDELHGKRPIGELTKALDDISELATTFHRGRIIRDGVRVVLIGPPNAGKSSLFNSLLRTHRAIVTETPGTTRDFIAETADFDGIPVTLVDTAGVRQTDDPIEAAGVERALTLSAEADLVLLLTETDSQFTFDLPPELASADKVMRVRTKSDLGPGDVSAVTGDGIDALIGSIRERIMPLSSALADHVVVTNERHFEALIEGRAAVMRAKEAAEAGETADIVAVDVQDALNRLGLIVGETTTDDILDRVFSTFCIGK
jgi:tRNA modification GTPase